MTYEQWINKWGQEIKIHNNNTLKQMYEDANLNQEAIDRDREFIKKCFASLKNNK